MKIRFKSSGGYANLQLSYNVDTNHISAQRAQELFSLIDSARVFELETSDEASTRDGPPDVLFYELSIEDENRNTSLAYNDMTVPDGLRPLLIRLQELAIEQRR